MNAPVSTPLVPAPGPRRPAGVVVAAVVLGLMTCWGLLSGALVIFGAIFVHSPQLDQYPVIEAVQIVMGVVVLLISGFCAYTVVGLFRMRNWARITILILGGLIAFFSLLSAGVYAAMALSSLAAHANAPGVSPFMMKAILLGVSGFSAVVGLIGVWWLVYFNLKRVRMLFAVGSPGHQQEIASQVPVAPAQIEPSGGNRSVMEAMLIGLAALYLLGSVALVIEAFLQVPIFFLGYVFRGTSAALILLAFGVINIWLGIGLLRRQKAAWVGALAVNGIGLVSLLGFLSPHMRAQMASYELEVTHRMLGAMSPPLQQQNQIEAMQGWAFLPGAIVGTVILGAIIWFLLLARPLFERKGVAVK